MRCRNRSDERGPAGLHLDEPLRLELRVDVARHAAGDADLLRQPPGGGKSDAGAQGAFADGAPQHTLECGPQGLARRPIEAQPTGLIK